MRGAQKLRQNGAYYEKLYRCYRFLDCGERQRLQPIEVVTPAASGACATLCATGDGLNGEEAWTNADGTDVTFSLYDWVRFISESRGSGMRDIHHE